MSKLGINDVNLIIRIQNNFKDMVPPKCTFLKYQPTLKENKVNLPVRHLTTRLILKAVEPLLA